MGQNNQDIVLEQIELITDLVVKRLDILTKLDCSKMTPEELVRAGACDPVRVFIKGEPHSTSKVEQSRWRLIFAVSIVDQLVERLLCSAQNKAEIELWHTCPSAPGLSLSSDEALLQLYLMIFKLRAGRGLAEADVVGWDWSVKEWELLLEAEMRIQLGNFNKNAAHLIRNRFACVSRSIYAMPDGSLIEMLIHGIQLSGTYCTSSTNSRLRVLLAMLVGADWAFAMGDDCVEDPVDDAHAKYAALGHALKMYQSRGTSFEFCSLIHTPEGAWPVDGTKTLYRLLEQNSITPELVAQFKQEMRNHPRREEFFASVDRVRSAQKTSLTLA